MRDDPRYPARYPLRYSARFEDSLGSEETFVDHDGETLRMRVRGVDFEGYSFDDWEPAENTQAELLRGFKLEPRLRELREFQLTCEFPVTVSEARTPEPGANAERPCKLVMRLELGRATPNGGADLEHLELTLSGDDFGPYESAPDQDQFFEDALRSIQADLPAGTFIKTCINCDFSDYSPYGQGLFASSFVCFRDVKEDYRRVDSKQDLFDIWDRHTEDVSETHLCPEFERRVLGRGYRG